MGFEENEISIKANGGTELTKRLLASRLPKDLLDNFQIISSRIRELDPTKIRVMFLHDLPEDPESAKLSDPAYRANFHKFVYVSDWQYSQYQTVLKVPYDINGAVLENCIVPFPEHEKPKDKIRLVYFSTPHRGLNILYAVFKELVKTHPDIHLDVFSSFNLYGWEGGDKQFEQLFKELDAHPNITNHGAVDQETLRAHLQKCHILAYPNIWPETSCRVLMESMSAGLLCVHPNYAALPHTAAGFTFMYQGDQDQNTHAALFYGALNDAVLAIKEKESRGIDGHLKFTKIYADNRFNVDNIVPKWEALLRQLLQQYPTVESRKLSTHVANPNELFTYDSSYKPPKQDAWV